MAQPVWITPAGNLGVIPVGVFFQLTLESQLPGEPTAELNYVVIAGKLPDGIQCAVNGTISGTPDSASLQGVPLEVARDTTSKFTVRTFPVNDPANIRDRTFTITIAVIPEPVWITPPGLVASYYDSDPVDFQFEFQEVYTPDTTVVTLVAGVLPGGLRLSLDGLLTGYVQPTPNAEAVAGYDISDQDTEPYDFISQSISKNFQFTLQVSNGHAASLRTFQIFVYSRDQMQASDAVLSVNSDVEINGNTYITADETPYQAPFIVNSDPSNLGTFRSSNYFAYQFVGENYISQPITYALSVNEGAGLPPGLVLDPTSGWYYGYIPNQGTTETDYSFNVTVYQNQYITPTITITQTQAATHYITANYITDRLQPQQVFRLASNFGGLVAGTLYYIDTIVSQTAVWNITNDQIVSYNTVFTAILADSSVPPLTNATGAVDATLIIECTATNTGSSILGTQNIITCSDTEYLGVGQPLVFTGTGFGGITANSQTIYYVSSIISETQFRVSAHPNSTTSVTLLNASGSMVANMILASAPYPFAMTITGAVDAEVIWDTPADLGDIINGSVSMLKVQATNRGGRTMKYRLKSGAYNSLPQGLQLMPSGDIVGRVSFDTFALDLGKTTIDQSFAINRNLASLGTTFDQTYEFTVQAYAEDLNQIIYKVDKIEINAGGKNYSDINKPTIAISAPVGASAIPAVAGAVTIVDGAITDVSMTPALGGVSGDGYTSPPTVTITQSFGGEDARLSAVMTPSGSRDAISVYKTFQVHVIREYDRPYQNLYVRAMPPPNDREIIRNLLDNQEVFPPDYLYRSDDPNFGKSVQVTYAHAFGLAPDTLERYVASLYENHYWKNLILGQIETARALDPITGEVVYEVVYSKIIDNLVNDAGQSVNKIVTLPYAIVDPADGSTIITSVYPNSLVNMRDQVIDVVGQISNTLPLWMTSKQTNGRVLGFTPAWVIAYVNPGRAREVAYHIETYFAQQSFAQQLNSVDFKVDRYILDRVLSQNWDSTNVYISGRNPPPGPVGDVLVGPGTWIPAPSTLTTFDRYFTGSKSFIGTVDICTSLAWSDVNNRSLDYINALGGLDGIIENVQGRTIIFAKQEYYNGPPGSNYPTITDAWQTWDAPSGGVSGSPDTYFSALPLDYSTTVPTTPENQRMAIYTINVNQSSKCLELTLTTQPVVDDYVQVLEGIYYRTAFLYYPPSVAPGFTVISWQFLPTIVTTETVFDANSLKFIAPVDMYDPTDTFDKYLVFPKSNILV